MRLDARAVLAALVAICQPASGDTNRTKSDLTMNAEINYMNTGSKVELSIKPDGLATLSIGSNRSNPDMGPVGVFRRKLDSADLTPLLASLRTSGFKGIQNPEFALSGEAVSRLSIKEEGQAEVMKWARLRMPVSPEFQAAESQAKAVVTLVREFPVQAVALQLTGLPAEIQRGNSLGGNIAITNAGAETIQIPAPENWTPQTIRLRLTGVRSDIPLEDLQEHHQKIEELSSKLVQNAQGAKPSKPMVALPANQRLVLPFKLTLDWPAGKYDVQICLSLPVTDQKGNLEMDCELLSKTHPLSVTGKGKARQPK